MTALRVLVVGCGIKGTGLDEASARLSHASAFRHCSDTELVAVCDINPELARKASETWGIPSYTELEIALTEIQPDIVSICTPNQTHEQILNFALKHNVTGLLIEKPLADDINTARRMAKAVSDAGATALVNYTRRFAEAYEDVADKLRNEDLGRFQAFHGTYTKGLIHNGTHLIDLLRWWAGEIAWVQGIPAIDNSENDPGIHVILGLEGGGTAFISACDAEAFTVFDADVLFHGGRLNLHDLGNRITVSIPSSDPQFPGHSTLNIEKEYEVNFANCMNRAVKELASSIQAGVTPRVTVEDALRAMEVAVMAQQSARLGKRITL